MIQLCNIFIVININKLSLFQTKKTKKYFPKLH